MTVLTRWDPYREFSSVQDRLNRLFNASFNEGRDESLTTSSFAPAVDVYEDEHNVTLKIEVPGIDEKDIDVRIENNTLTVHGERKLEKDEKEENYRRIERQYGSFTRTFTLPTTVDHGRRFRQLRERCAEGKAGQEGRSQAQADQSQRRRRKDAGRQEPEQSRVIWQPMEDGRPRPSALSAAGQLPTGGGRLTVSRLYLNWAIARSIWLSGIGQFEIPSGRVHADGLDIRSQLPNCKIAQLL